MAKTISAELRTQISKGNTNGLRRSGRIPAVVYGGKEPAHVSVDAHAFSLQFKKINESEIFTLEIGKDKRQVLIKDYQKNYLKGNITHLDFFEVSKDHALKTHVPLHLGALPAEARATGGMLENHLHELEIECLPGAIPEFIEVDLSALTGHHAIHVRDIKAPKGVKILTNADQVVASLTHVKAEAVAATETAAAPAT